MSTSTNLDIKLDNLMGSLTSDNAILGGVPRRRTPASRLMVDLINRGATPFQAKVMAIAMEPNTHDEFSDGLDLMWSINSERGFLVNGYPEVVVGGGLHAAIYCTVRHRKTGIRPLVLEATDHPGGKFAISRRPSFFTNSRNRPGDLPGIPGDLAPLNVLPGFVIQPSMLSLAEFQANTEIAFPIRLALAMHGDVRTGSKVSGVNIQKAPPYYYIDKYNRRRASRRTPANRFKITLADGRNVYCKRIINARGMGYAPQPVKSKHATTFLQFMQRMGSETFPLRGLRRVAVIGAGDSARCAIEALCGQGPGGHLSTAALDWVEVIDWYGAVASTCDEWMQVSRSRYKRIGSLLPRSEGASRVRVIQAEGFTVPGYNCAYVNNVPYDLVIECRGFTPYDRLFGRGWYRVAADNLDEALSEDSQKIALARRSTGEDAWTIGSTGDLEFDGLDTRRTRSIPANRDAIFRLGARTAMLAQLLP